MDQAINVFLNGIAGVFAGMAVLYLTMRLIALLISLKQEPKEE